MPERPLPPPPSRKPAVTPVAPTTTGLGGLPAHLSRPKTVISNEALMAQLHPPRSPEAEQAAQAAQAIRDQSLETQGYHPGGFAGVLDTSGQALGASGHALAQLGNAGVAGLRSTAQRVAEVPGDLLHSYLSNDFGDDSAGVDTIGQAQHVPVPFIPEEISQRYIDAAQSHGEAIDAYPSPTARNVGHGVGITANLGAAVVNPPLAVAQHFGEAKNDGYSDMGAAGMGGLYMAPGLGRAASGLGGLAERALLGSSRVLPRVVQPAAQALARAPIAQEVVAQGVIGGGMNIAASGITANESDPRLGPDAARQILGETGLNSGIGGLTGAALALLTRGRGAFGPPRPGQVPPSIAAPAPRPDIQPEFRSSTVSADPVLTEGYGNVNLPQIVRGEFTQTGSRPTVGPDGLPLGNPGDFTRTGSRPTVGPDGLPAINRGELVQTAELPGEGFYKAESAPPTPEGFNQFDAVPPTPEGFYRAQPRRPDIQPQRNDPTSLGEAAIIHPTEVGDTSPVEVPPSWELPGRFNRRGNLSAKDDPFGGNIDQRANAESTTDLTPVTEAPARPDPFAEYNGEPEKLGAMGRLDKSLPETELQLDPVAQRAEQATESVAPVRENIRPEYGSDTTRVDLPITGQSEPFPGAAGSRSRQSRPDIYPERSSDTTRVDLPITRATSEVPFPEKAAKPGLRHLSPEAQDWVMKLKPGERELLRDSIADRAKHQDTAGDKGNLQMILDGLIHKRDKKPGARPKTVAPDEGAVPRPTSSRAEADLVQGGFRRQGEPTPKAVDVNAPTERIAKPVTAEPEKLSGVELSQRAAAERAPKTADEMEREFDAIDHAAQKDAERILGKEQADVWMKGRVGEDWLQKLVDQHQFPDFPPHLQTMERWNAKFGDLFNKHEDTKDLRRFSRRVRQIEQSRDPEDIGVALANRLYDLKRANEKPSHKWTDREAESVAFFHAAQRASAKQGIDPDAVTKSIAKYAAQSGHSPGDLAELLLPKKAREAETPAQPATPGRFGLRPPDNSRQGALNVSDPLEALGKGIAKVSSKAAEPVIGGAKLVGRLAKGLDKPYSKPLVDVVRDLPGGKPAAEKADKVLTYGKELVGKFESGAQAALKAITKGPKARAARASFDEVNYRGKLGFARIGEVLDGAIPARPAEEAFRKEIHSLTYRTGLHAEKDGYTINVGDNQIPFKADKNRQRFPRIGTQALHYFADKPSNPESIALAKAIAAENPGLKPGDVFGEFKAWSERGITKRGMAEDARTIKNFPTHWVTPEGKTVQLLETSPQKIIQAIATRFPERIAFRKIYGPEAVPKEFADLEKHSGEAGKVAGENLFRSLHRMTLHDSVSDIGDTPHPASAAAATRDWTNFPMQAVKEAHLSMAWLSNMPEMLGKPRAIAGNVNMAKAIKDVLFSGSSARKAIMDDLARRGAITRDLQDWYVNKSNYAETATRFTRNTLGAARHFVDEFNERVSAQANKLWAEGLQKGKGGGMDRIALSLQNYTPEQVNAIIKGGFSDRVLSDITRRATVNAQSLRAHPAERSRLGNSPAWTNFTIGDQYAQQNQNRNLRMWGQVAKEAMNPDASWSERVKPTLAALGFASNAAAGQMGAAALTLVARAMIYGGGAVLTDKAFGSPLGLGDFLSDTFRTAFIGGPAQAAVNLVTAANGKVTDDIVRPFLPISTMQEMRDMLYATGKYDGMGGIEAAGKFLSSSLAVTPMIANIASITGMSQDDAELGAGIKAFRKWEAEYAPSSRVIPAASPDGFRAAMRKAADAIQKGTDPSEALMEALGTRKASSAAESLRGKKILPSENTPKGKADRAKALEYLGPATMHKLEMYDHMLDVWTRRIHPPE